MVLPTLWPDWEAGWHRPLLPLGPRVMQHWQQTGDLCVALNAWNGPACVRFVPQEQFIYDTRQVPTRSNWHDFFNGLMWLHFPLAKLRLNALQGEELARLGGVGATRGPVRDALTLFDENVALLQAPDALWDALAWKRWEEVFDSLRALWAESRLVLFGHATLEQLVQPFKGITAHVYRVPTQVGPGSDGPDGAVHWDAWLAGALTADHLRSKPFVHLPVLGVPGWWAANTEPDFYRDTSVFRPLRRLPSVLQV